MERLIYSERLLQKLEALRQARIAVLEAPAGYGKTTAVSRALEGAARSKEGCASARYQELSQVQKGLLEMREEWRNRQL